MPSDLLHPFAKPLPAYRDMTFDTLERHWSDPAYRARCEAERAHQQELMNATIDATMPDAWQRLAGRKS